MKFSLIMLLALSSWAVQARDVEDFNRALLQDVQKDIKTDNDYNSKKATVMRGPASVQPEADSQEFREDLKIDKTVRQTGGSKW